MNILICLPILIVFCSRIPEIFHLHFNENGIMAILFVLFPSHGLCFTQWMSSLPEFVACSFFSANQQSNHVEQDHSSWPSGCRCQREHGSNSHQHLTNCNLPSAAMIFVQWKHICKTLVSTWDYESSQVFGGRLYQQLKDEPGNIIMSPFSISGVMAMVGIWEYCCMTHISFETEW